MGPAAESAAIALLAYSDVTVRVIAANLLGDVGGPKSIAPLRERLAKDASAEFKSAAKRAIERIQAKK